MVNTAFYIAVELIPDIDTSTKSKSDQAEEWVYSRIKRINVEETSGPLGTDIAFAGYFDGPKQPRVSNSQSTIEYVILPLQYGIASGTPAPDWLREALTEDPQMPGIRLCENGISTSKGSF